jgi:hypothetical protein
MAGQAVSSALFAAHLDEVAVEVFLLHAFERDGLFEFAGDIIVGTTYRLTIDQRESGEHTTDENFDLHQSDTSLTFEVTNVTLDSAGMVPGR